MRQVGSRVLPIAPVLAVVGLFCILAPGAPTGLGWWDTILRVGFGILVLWLALRIPFVVLAVLGAGVAAVSGGSVWSLAALGAVAIALVGIVGSIPPGGMEQVAKAAVGALMAVTMLHLGDRWFFGGTAAFVGVIVAMMAAYVGAGAWTAGHRPKWRVLGLGLGVLGLIMGAVFGLAYNARNDLDSAIQSGHNAANLARSGRVDQATTQLEAAQDKLGSLETRAGAWWVQPARLVPVLGRQIEFAHIGLSEAMKVADLAVTVAPAFDTERWSPDEGRIDTDQVEAAYRALSDLDAALFAMDERLQAARDPWVLRPLDRRVGEAIADVRSARSYSGRAIEALRLLPEALGADRPHRYFVVFGNPAEARELGGLLSAYALMQIDQGEVVLVDVGANDRLVRDVRTDPLDYAQDYPDSYRAYEVDRLPLNLTATPDLATMYRAIQDVFPELGRDLDGVIYVDPFGVEGLIELGGSIRLQIEDIRLTGTSTANFLLMEQYALLPQPAQRDRLLVDVLETTLLRVVQRGIADPERARGVLEPLVAQGRVQMVTDDAETNALLTDLGLFRPFADRGPGDQQTDFLAVIHSNAGENKLDPYLERSVSYTVRANPETGEVAPSVRVDLRSSASLDLPDYVLGLPANDDRPVGVNRLVLSVYSPHGLRTITVNNQPSPSASFQEFGIFRHSIIVDVVPGGTTSVNFDLTGELDFTANGYELRVGQQPLAVADTMEVTVATTSGWRLGTADVGQPVRAELLLGQPAVLTWSVTHE